MGPARAHKSLESMFGFEQTLLDQTGQESLVGSEEEEKKEQMQHENKNKANHLHRAILKMDYSNAVAEKLAKFRPKAAKTEFNKICPQLCPSKANNQATSNMSFHICLFSY